MFDRAGRSEELFKDLFLVAVGMVIVSTVSVRADIAWGNFFLLGFALALGGSRSVRSSRGSCSTTTRSASPGAVAAAGRRSSGALFAVLVLGWLILPFYFITSGVYMNWPVVDTPEMIARLFVGVGAVGIWDELFFICTVFALLRAPLPDVAGEPAAGDRLRVVPVGARLPGVGAAAHDPVRAAAGVHLQAHALARLRRDGAPAVRRGGVPRARARAQRRRHPVLPHLAVGRYPARMAEIKTKPTGEDVTAYLDSVPHERRRAEGHAVRALMERASGEPATMWGPSMIGFGSRPVDEHNGTNDWFVIGFSPRKAALTIYGVYDDYGPANPLFDSLGPHTTGKSCLYIKRLDAVDFDVLERLVREAWARNLA